MRLDPDQIDARVAQARVARLATRGADGRPHVVPVVFALAGGRIWSPVDGKPKSARRLARLRNVARDPRVCLLLDHYEEDWRTLWWVRLDGRGAVVEHERPDEAPDLAAAVAALRAKYPQYREARTPLFRGVPTLVRIEVTRAVGWRA